MSKIFEMFLGDETGNAAIDWLILTAGVVMLGSAILAATDPAAASFAATAGTGTTGI